MKTKLLLACAVLAVLASPASAVVVNIQTNPNSSTGNFSLAPGAGAFEDQVVFGLSGGPQFITIANATNTFAGPGDEITNWIASILSAGLDGIVNNADDVLLFGPQAASPCVTVQNCQFVGGSGVIEAPGLYYAEFIGTGSGTSGYSGNISSFAVPGPIVGAGIPGIVAACAMLFGLARRRRALAA